ncbi:MAG TPA: Do family serine endopeptidase [Deltaproteobacteria bacterium]|nr:Do family serine endopeptidase [Candidatus Lambdaproteobacteria bacterium]HIN48206.1 Do family serine endopeptidase [Deltaproteobacteria bacterium]HIO83548.1 Do family serine endopeptidase [Deltaproteobacteria bacterium]
MKLQFPLLTLVLFLLIFWSTPAAAQNTDDLEQMIRASKTRAILVQNVQKAVVHIKVEKIMRNPDGQALNNPMDLYNDEFFRRFFPELRPPKNQRQKNRQNPNRQFRQQGMGSGSIIDSKGYILTNHHVVGEADRILVILYDGTEKEAKLVGTDPETDIAVVKIEGNGLPVLPMGNSDEILVGEDVIAVGNPFGLIQTVTYGIISAKGRSNVGINEYENFIQTDAAINPGNSGGPLVSLRGEIIGVNSAIFTRSGGYQGIGFAVPINMARKIMRDLIDKGTVSRGWLGVGIQNVSHDLAQAFQLDNTKGSLITGVMPDTPAKKAGMRKGDVVIRINEKSIRDSNHLRNEIANAGAFADIEIELIRDGKSVIIQLKLDERPRKLGQIKVAPQPVPTIEQVEMLGMIVEELTEKTAKQLGIETGSGIVIVEVKPGSPAEKTGLLPGMIVQEVERHAIANLSIFKELVSEMDPEKGILLLITSAKGSRYIFLHDN